MGKFTAGPWHANGVFVGGPFSNEGDDIVSGIGNRDEDESLANAALISAAPEMYEALNELAKLRAETHKGCPIVKKAFYAINKAEGY